MQQESDNATNAKSPRKTRRTVYGIITAAAVIGIGIYIAFFGESSIVQAVSYQRTIDSLERCIQQQQDSLDYYRALNQRITTDPALTEQVVREQYNMKRDNEDIFIIK